MLVVKGTGGKGQRGRPREGKALPLPLPLFCCPVKGEEEEGGHEAPRAGHARDALNRCGLWREGAKGQQPRDGAMRKWAMGGGSEAAGAMARAA